MMKKRIKKIATSLVFVLSIGGLVIGVKDTNVSAKTVVSQSAKQTIITFTNDDLEKATGVKLTTENVHKMYILLSDIDSWKSLDYSDTQAKKISKRVSASKKQTQGILKDMVTNPYIEFKVVYISNGWFERVNIGSEKGTTQSLEGTTPEVNHPVINGLDSNIQEIKIDIEYRQDKKDIELDVDIKDDGRVKAEFENEGTRTKIKGTQAEKIAVNVFKEINVKTMTKDEIKHHVLTKLDADTNTKEFEFNVKYFDGTSIEFKIK